MRFKFIQTGDLHVGRWRQSSGQTVALERASMMFDRIYETAREVGADAVLITGDVFDTANPTEPERDLVTRKLAQYAGRAGTKTCVIGGNHDFSGRNRAATNYLAELRDEVPNLHVAFAHEVALWPVAEGLTVIGASAHLSEDQEWVENFVANLPEDQQYVFMGHGMVQGSKADSGYSPKGARMLSLAKASQSAQVVFWAFGDVHMRQSLPSLAEGAHGAYAGSPVPMRFDEEPGRGVLMVALDRSAEGVWGYRGRRFIPIDHLGFAPIVEVDESTDMTQVPKNAILKRAPGLVLGEDRKVVKVSAAKEKPVGLVESAEFDPATASLEEVKRAVLGALKPGTTVSAREVLEPLVEVALEKYQSRLYNE